MSSSGRYEKLFGSVAAATDYVFLLMPVALRLGKVEMYRIADTSDAAPSRTTSPSYRARP